MLSGITTLCFTASYAVALALEASRLLFRSGVRGAVMLGFAGAGVVAQTLFLFHRAATNTGGAPLSSAYDWYLLAAWLLAVAYLYLTYYHPRAPMGLFLLPLVLALIGAAQLADQQPFAQTPATRMWGAVHGAFLAFGAVAVLVGFVAGVMYLLQAHRLKRKLPPPSGLRLPSLEWLEHVNSRALVISVLMFGTGFLAGIVLNAVNHSRQLDELPWSDPVIWRSAALFGWLLAAALFSVLYKPAQRGRKVAYLTVASFVFLWLSMAIRMFVESEHGGFNASPTARTEASP